MITFKLPLVSKEFNKYPKFRHNLWTAFSENSETTYLTVSHSKFEVPTSDAEKFLCIRSHCTGHNTVEEIAEKSGLDSEEVKNIIQPLIDNDILHLPVRRFESLDKQEIQETLMAGCRIWAEQLAENHIINEIANGTASKQVFMGWLLEMYHYIKNFPEAIELAAKHANGQLREVLEQYANEERGHEEFVTRTLVSLGFSRDEVEQSIPLVSTRTIDLLMRELFEIAPVAALLVAAIVEADELSEDDLLQFRNTIAGHYQVSADALIPFQEHMVIDERLGHANLANENLSLIKVDDAITLHRIVNGLHDVKHAFDLQKLEIKTYYSQMGNYIPRQFVDFFAI